MVARDGPDLEIDKGIQLVELFHHMPNRLYFEEQNGCKPVGFHEQAPTQKHVQAFS